MAPKTMTPKPAPAAPKGVTATKHGALDTLPIGRANIVHQRGENRGALI